jgi:hypothetical protein
MLSLLKFSLHSLKNIYIEKICSKNADFKIISKIKIYFKIYILGISAEIQGWILFNEFLYFL